ncbi:hypothetical protein HIM_11977 [Hirsutella minnesotensis 3608]|uniref:RNase H type-1 domain-containing protein n=1 Tax=Hirsutella minnesotensis 3608 TaxID=1043627 RepID=A0A0F7ZWA5_9HYPO|nr:hypothetical protein HIM_11977 [Hirsutella minnesotensis 3608]
MEACDMRKESASARTLLKQWSGLRIAEGGEGERCSSCRFPIVVYRFDDSEDEGEEEQEDGVCGGGVTVLLHGRGTTDHSGRSVGKMLLRKGKVGMGGVVRDASRNSADEVLASYSVTLGSSDEQNAYTAGLEAIAVALRRVPLGLHDRDLTIVTSNRSVLQVIGRPRQQSGQCTIREIYGSVEYLWRRGCRVRLRWVRAKNEKFTLGPLAKMQAKRATRDECSAEPATFQARSTTLRLLLNEHARAGQIPERVGKYSKRIDKALPGKHIRL